MWHVLPKVVAVLTEGLPGAFYYMCPLGDSGCIHGQGLLFWHRGFFLKISTPPLGSAKYGFQKVGSFQGAGPQKTNMLEPEYSRDYWQIDFLKEGRLNLLVFKLYFFHFGAHACTQEVFCRQKCGINF